MIFITFVRCNFSCWMWASVTCINTGLTRLDQLSVIFIFIYFIIPFFMALSKLSTNDACLSLRQILFLILCLSSNILKRCIFLKAVSRSESVVFRYTHVTYYSFKMYLLLMFALCHFIVSYLPFYWIYQYKKLFTRNHYWASS